MTPDEEINELLGITDVLKQMADKYEAERIQRLRDHYIEMSLTSTPKPAISSAPRRADASPRQ